VRHREVRKQIETLGAEPEAMLPGDFRACLEKEAEVWLPVARRASTSQQ
jgi:tripartite-type tricarboxylate transporter receptor subunit TctC